ncbi:MAG: hypothetical protein ACFB2Z_08690 [Maricaulaceae bacterium]
MTDAPPPVAAARAGAAPWVERFSAERVWVVWLLGAVALAAFVALGYILWLGLEVEHWRHDSFRYLTSEGVERKLREEGRWIAYLAFPALKSVSPHALFVLDLALIIAAAFVVFRRFSADDVSAAALALSVGLFPGVAAQLLWPITVFPSCVILLFTVWLVDRYGVWALPPAMVLVLGAAPLAAFVLPLAALPARLARDEWDAAGFVGVGVVWGLSLGLGVLVASLMNGVLLGEIGVEPADWRRSRPLETWADLQGNVDRARRVFQRLITLNYPDISRIAVASLALVGLGLGVVVARGKRVWLTLGVRMGYLGVLFLGPFGVAVLGYALQTRSLLSWAFALAAGALLVLPGSLHRVGAAVTLIVVGLPGYLSSREDLSWFVSITQANQAAIDTAVTTGVRTGEPIRGVLADVSGFSNYYAEIEARSHPRPATASLERMNASPRVLAGFMEYGLDRPIECAAPAAGVSEHGQCAQLRALPANQCADLDSLICVFGVREGLLWVRLAP